MKGQNAVGSIKLGSMQSSCACPRDGTKKVANTTAKIGMKFFMICGYVRLKINLFYNAKSTKDNFNLLLFDLVDTLLSCQKQRQDT